MNSTSQSPEQVPGSLPPGSSNDKNETSSLVLAIVGVCFAGISALTSLLGSFCCGWAGYPFGFVGLVLAIISLALRRSILGWVTLGLVIFTFAWPPISAMLLVRTTTSGASAVLQQMQEEARRANQSRPYNPGTRSGSFGGQPTSRGTGQ